MKLTPLLTAILLLAGCPLQSQDDPVVLIRKADKAITLDGKLEEGIWADAEPVGPWWQHFPADSLEAVAPTTLYLSYDQEFLYVGFICYSSGDEFIVPSLRRDFRAGGNDNLSLLLDTYNDRTNAFLFGLNPYGVQREALISNGGSGIESFQTSWDQKWYSATSREGNSWTGEMAIPFSSIRYTETNQTWRISGFRFDTQTNEQSTLVRNPRNQLIFNLAFSREIRFESALPKPGSNIVVIPYLTGGVSQDFEAGQSSPARVINGGMDIKVGIGPSLNLDLTINPDFSQVEVDRQQTNLDRFELFFPERRQFFLENADLFSSFGTNRDRPFFSRRIGISRDTSTGQNIQNAIPFGARLTGKLNPKTRVGLISMQAASDQENGLPAYLYTVAAVQRQLFARSNISFIAVNRQATSSSDGDWGWQGGNFARVIGADLNLASADNVWTGKAYYHRSFVPSSEQGAFTTGGALGYKVRDWELQWTHRWVGAGYEAPVGFVPRTDYQMVNPRIRRYFYPQKGAINLHGPGLEAMLIRNDAYGRTDHTIEVNYELNFTNNNRIRASLNQNYIYLFSAFDPSGTNGLKLPESTEYTFHTVEAQFRSDRRKPISYSIETTLGQYFNGYRNRLQGFVTWRFQPFGLVSLNAQVNQITLPEPYNSSILWLIGPRIDLTFSRNLFLSTFIQYNSQLDNINVNARLQWRFKPVSDLFIVYTDNYLPGMFSVKNRALVLKLTYWLNL